MNVLSFVLCITCCWASILPRFPANTLLNSRNNFDSKQSLTHLHSSDGAAVSSSTKILASFPRTQLSENYINVTSSIIESGTRVVTDIDDTVKSSGGVKLLGIPLGGIDVRI